MSPITHLLISWSIANAAKLEKRDRFLVTMTGVLPDADGAGIVVDYAMRFTSHPTDFWTQWHHVLGHNLGFALALTIAAGFAAQRRFMTALLAFTAVHVHLACDILGARGPDGDQWPIPYLSPFYQGLNLSWEGQWALNAWPNFVITGVFLCLMFWIAVKREASPLEFVSQRANQAFVETLKTRFAK
ncbi:metal-dependent hydrolase [Desulfatibacillum aliphaticivorans]|uniref:metal-dependent hydrolase n=1 Tax=Desulfatibacillum aliphaticivorans TaxID=218208 RepID=UPI00048080B8|nr:metal-dependent hydrolase [Desulfatibacillum aliphaticivorans]